MKKHKHLPWVLKPSCPSRSCKSSNLWYFAILIFLRPCFHINCFVRCIQAKNNFNKKLYIQPWHNYFWFKLNCICVAMPTEKTKNFLMNDLNSQKRIVNIPSPIIFIFFFWIHKLLNFHGLKEQKSFELREYSFLQLMRLLQYTCNRGLWEANF